MTITTPSLYKLLHFQSDQIHLGVSVVTAMGSGLHCFMVGSGSDLDTSMMSVVSGSRHVFTAGSRRRAASITLCRGFKQGSVRFWVRVRRTAVFMTPHQWHTPTQ